MAVDQAKALPMPRGDTHYVIHRVRPVATNDPKKIGVPVSEDDKQPAGWYYATLWYTEIYSPRWSF